MFRIVAIIALSLSLFPDASPAQSRVSAEAAAYRARIDSLLPEYRAAQRALARVDSVRKAEQLAAQREPLDSLFFAPFVVVTPHSKAARVLPIFRNAIEERHALLAQLEDAPPITLLIERDSQYRAFQSMAKAPRHHKVSLLREDRERDRRIVGNAIDDALMDLAPPSVRAWLLDGRIARGHNAKSAYRALATSPSAMAQRCHDGGAEDCVLTLGLGAPFDSARGYTNEQIRMFAVRAQGTNRRAYTDCRDSGIMAQCFAVLRPYGGPPLPLGNIPRANFLAFALERGGAGSMARLNASGPDAAAAIAAAAGTDVRTLAREWREDLEAAKPLANAGTGLAGLATLVWAVAAMLFAIRSTRRRL